MPERQRRPPLQAVASGSVAVGGVLAVLAVQIFSPERVWPWLRVVAALASRTVSGALVRGGAAPPEALQRLLRLPQLVLQPLAGPSLFFILAPPVLNRLCPPLVRSAVFYRHTFRLFAGYLRTLFLDAPAAARALMQSVEVETVWKERHRWGAERVHAMLEELSGFYLKVGQVFATKADLLPPAYPRSLRRLFDACPPAPFWEVQRTLERELRAPLAQLFASFERQPLATATIAQVHRAVLHDGRKVAVKVQHAGMESLMESDISNMLRVVQFIEWAGLDLNFDQQSILREYRTQVPLEFDFCRERSLLEAVGTSIRTNLPTLPLSCPLSVPALSSRRVLTMEFMDGTSLSKLHELAEAAAAAGAPPPRGTSPSEVSALMVSLLTAFGQQIFVEGVFHSDPHPGNVLLRPDGSVGLLDFGECKELEEAERIQFARMTIALAQRNPETVLPLLRELGVVVEGATPEFALTVAYIIFDTRMDIPEAHMSPLDADAGEMRTARLRTLPPDLFMLVRVITLLRGTLSLFDADASASLIWEPFARAALVKAGVPPPPPPRPKPALAPGAPAPPEPMGIYEKMTVLAQWMQANELPHDRKAMTPFAMGGLLNVALIAASTDEKLLQCSRTFTAEQRARCKALAVKATAEAEAAEAEAARARAAAAPVAASKPAAAAKAVAAPKAKGGWFKSTK